MSARNRVTPLGDVVAIGLRGAWTGNRGVLHSGHEIVRPWASNLWITCALRFRDRRREQWLPGRYTHLYFHDEAVSFAAGHRPCAECRRAAYVAYRDAWATGLGRPAPSAEQMNRQLHAERVLTGTRQRRLHRLSWRDLPDGAFVVREDTACVVVGDRIVEWSSNGYRGSHPRPRAGEAVTITPPASLAALRAGYAAQIDAAAQSDRQSGDSRR
ncbi:MAG: hypothetical protein JO147_10705 [Actinobacteria bacterium]|nr:hypothetical protein [Actinomycetota bacterium]